MPGRMAKANRLEKMKMCIFSVIPPTTDLPSPAKLYQYGNKPHSSYSQSSHRTWGEQQRQPHNSVLCGLPAGCFEWPEERSWIMAQLELCMLREQEKGHPSRRDSICSPIDISLKFPFNYLTMQIIIVANAYQTLNYLPDTGIEI